MITIKRVSGFRRGVPTETQWHSVMLRDAQHPQGIEIGVMHESNGQFVATVKHLSEAVVAGATKACAEQHLERIRSEEQRALAAAQMAARPAEQASSVEADETSDDNEDEDGRPAK